MPFAPGTIIDNKFRIIARIGAGGMGTVFSAEQIELNRTVALKVLADTGPLDEESTARFLQEAQIISQLHHKNIVSIYAFGQFADSPYIAMEFVAGNSLQSLLQDNKPLDVQFILKTGIQICAALSHAHKNGIVHRDLKPANIMLATSGDVTVIDFGFAKVFQADAARRQQQLTEAGCAVGSILYMSPEQCQGNAVDGRADIYGLGCVLYHCLTGHPPFDGDHSVSIMFKHVNDNAPRLVGANTELEQVAEIQRILDMAMARDVGSRYQSADEMLQDLSLAATNITSLTLQTESPSSDAHKQGQQPSVKQLIGQRQALPLIFGCSILIACTLFLITLFFKSQTAAQDQFQPNLTPTQYIQRLESLHGIDRLEFLKNNRNSAGREETDRGFSEKSVSEIHLEADRLMKASKLNEAFTLLRRTEESLRGLPPRSITHNGKLSIWVIALDCQLKLPVSQRIHDIPELTERFIGECKAEEHDEVFSLANCITRLEQLGYPKEALILCPKAARGLEHLNAADPSMSCQSLYWACVVGGFARRQSHHDIKNRMITLASGLAQKSKNGPILAELATWGPLWDPNNLFANYEELLLAALRINDPAGITAVQLNLRLIAFYRLHGKQDLAERLTKTTLLTLAKIKSSPQTRPEKEKLEHLLYAELFEANWHLQKRAEMFAVMNRWPPSDKPDHKMQRLHCWARLYIYDKKFAQAQECIDDALSIQIQPNDADHCIWRCKVLLRAGLLARKRADERSAQEYWRSANSLASTLKSSHPERLAQCQQMIDDFKKASPDPNLF